jgi:hypothetical protein
MTSVLPAAVAGELELELEVAELEAPGALVVELLDEQAASPAARSPVAAMATALLDIGLIVNFDCPLGRYLVRANCIHFWGMSSLLITSCYFSGYCVGELI